MSRISNRSIISFFAMIATISILVVLLFANSNKVDSGSFTIEKGRLISMPFNVVLPTTFSYDVEISDGRNASVYLISEDQLPSLMSGGNFVSVMNASFPSTGHAVASTDLNNGRYALVIVNGQDTISNEAIAVHFSSTFRATGTTFSWAEIIISATLLVLSIALMALVLVCFKGVSRKGQRTKVQKVPASTPLCKECKAPVNKSAMFCDECGHLV